MKLSVQSLWRNAVKTAQRFPVVVADALVVTALALTNNWGYAKGGAYPKLLLTFILGFPLLLSLKLFAERRNWPAKTQALFPLLGMLPLAVYYFTLTLPGLANGIRFGVLLASALFFLSFAPYTSRGEVNGFWRYNKALVLGFAASGFASIALMTGISIALAGINYLLGVHVPDWLYGKLWLITGCFIWPFIFLATAPEDFEQFETAEIFDKVLETFVRFIIIPLVLLYMLILYLYAGKIIIQATWPKGGVAGFILGFSCLGLLSILLIHPLRNKEGSQWTGSYLKWLSIAILFQTVMLFLSVWRRVAEYGVTESRYYGVLEAVWLAGVCVYFLVSKAKSIKAISVSLCIAAFLSAFGPWGALAVSEQSQMGRLESLLKKNGILSDGKVVKATKAVSPEDQGSISQIVKYLHERHGLRPFKRWFIEDLSKVKSGDRPNKIVNLMGLSYAPYYAQTGQSGSDKYFSYHADRSGFLKVSGYDYYLRLGPYAGEDSCDDGGPQCYPIEINGRKYKASLDAKTGKFLVTRDKETIGSVDVLPLARKLRQQYKDAPESYSTVPQSDMVVEGRAGNVAIKIVFSELHVVERKETLELTSAKGDALLKVGE